MRYLFLFLFAFLFFSTAFAQTPFEADSTVLDTVVVYKDPHVIKQTVHVNKGKSSRPKKSFTGIETGGAAFNNYYYAKVCEECIEYYDSLKTFRSPSLSYSFSLQVNHYRNRFFFHGGVSYSVVREKLTYYPTTIGDSAYKYNQFRSLDFQLGVGYAFATKYFHVIPEGAFIFSTQLERIGHTLKQNTNGELTLLENDDRFQSYSYRAMVACRFMFLPGKRLRPSLEPFYSGDLNSFTKKEGQYVLYRNSAGLKVFLCFFL